MGTRGETEWQLEKTLVESARYMLDNEISTDVCFEVGPPGDDTVQIRAHKFVLISRSPVFEAMFSSGMTECRSDLEAKVRIEDIDADVFKEVLIYMYCENTSFSPETAALVWYAAKKYFLPKLITECHRCLLRSLNINNVIWMLEQALQFDHQPLVSDCLKLISLNSKAVLTGEEILSASRQAMEAILDADTIPIRESVIYETAINWAKHQLQSVMPAENPTDLQMRETIGDLLYKIRFPVMKPVEFAETTAEHSILTAEEKDSIYYFLLTKRKTFQLKFPTERRIGEEFWVQRGSSCAATDEHSIPSAGVAAFNFRTDHDVLLTGLGLYTAQTEEGYDADLEILQSVDSLVKKSVKVPFSDNPIPVRVLFDEPIMILAEVLYSVKVVSHGPIQYFMRQSAPVCRDQSVRFAFSNHSASEADGQIPRLFFCRL